MRPRIDPEFRALIPPLSADELAQLEANIVADGCRDPLVIWAGEDILLDGHNRLDICERHNLGFKTEHIILPDRDAAKVWIIDNQAGRRNLTAYVRTELALLKEDLIAARARANQRTSTGGAVPQLLPNLAKAAPVHTRAEVAHAARVSTGTVQKVKELAEKAPEEVKQQLRSGEVSINAAYTAIKREEKKEEIRERMREGKTPILPANTYSIIYADPPWQYDFAPTTTAAIEQHYKTMPVEDICQLVDSAGKPVQDCFAPNSVLLLWATAPKLLEALEVMEAWGFQYKTQAVWDKEKTGMGYWFLNQHELLLVGTKGTFSPPLPEHRWSSVFREARREHSEKPDCVRKWVETAWPVSTSNPYHLELFGRKLWPGWAVWGNDDAVVAA